MSDIVKKRCSECKMVGGKHASTCQHGLDEKAAKTFHEMMNDRVGMKATRLEGHECTFEVKLDHRDPVNHPPHYTHGGVEVIDAIEAWGLGFHEGNVVKYVARAKHKGNELQDLEKAKWYLERRIAELKK